MTPSLSKLQRIPLRESWKSEAGDFKALRDEVAFFQAVKVILTKRDICTAKKTNEQRDAAIRQIISQAVVSESVVDIGGGRIL